MSAVTKRWTRVAVLAALAVMLAGCGGGGGGGGVTNPPPPTTTHTETESNDFNAQSLGTLGSTEISVGGTSSSDADVDLYRVTLASTTNIHVVLQWTGAQDLDFAVSNTAAVIVRHQDTASNPEQCNLNSLPAGNYTLRVGSRSGTAAGYVLKIGSH